LIAGQIDRIDQAADPPARFRILDYKLGSRHLTKKDLANGRRLQLALYALAARDALGLGAAADGAYVVLNSDTGIALRLSSYESPFAAAKGVDAALADAARRVGRIVAGARRGEFPARPLSNTCPRYCVAAGWCWRYRSEEW